MMFSLKLFFFKLFKQLYFLNCSASTTFKKLSAVLNLLRGTPLIYRQILSTCLILSLLILSTPWAQETPQFREKKKFIQELDKISKPEEPRLIERRFVVKEGLFFLKPTFGTNFTYFEDSIGDRIRQISQNVQLYHTQNISFFYGVDLVKFEEEEVQNIYLTTDWLEFRASFSENFSTALYYGFKDYHNGGGDEHEFSVRINHILNEKLLTTLEISHSDVTQNNPAILENLEVTQGNALFEWLQTDQLSFQGGYVFYDYSDHNFSNTWYLGAKYIWWDYPIVTTSYQYAYNTFNFPSDFYFSFDKFQIHTIDFAWEQNINDDFGYAFRNNITTDNADRGAWASQLTAEVFIAPHPDIFVFLQYAYYDGEVLKGKSFTSNTVFASFSISF